MKHRILTAPHHTHELMTMLLQEKTHVFNTSVRTVDFALKPQLETLPEMMIAVYQAINPSDFPYLGPVLNTPKTLNALIQFCNTLDLYRLDLSHLPQATPLQKEIHGALSIIRPYVSPYQIPKDTTLAATYCDLTHAETSFLEHHRIPHYPLPTQQPSQVSVKYALNIRSEIEACIQEILQQEISGAVVSMPNLSSHLPLIESILMRYGINQPLEDRGIVMAKHHFLALCAYLKNPSLKTILALVEHNVLAFKYSDDLHQYITHFELSADHLLAPFDHAGSLFLDLQTRIQADVGKLQSFLTQTQTLTYSQNIVMFYELLQGQSNLNLAPIAALLESNPALTTPEYADFLHYFIDAIAIVQMPLDRIQFVDIKKLPAYPVSHLYVLNLTTAHYPNTPKASGILDEQYLDGVEGYPSAATRNSFALAQQARFLQLSDHLTLSYSVSSYEGKGQEISYPIHVYCDENAIKPTPWLLQQVLYRPKTHFHLAPTSAKNLYLKEGLLTGSISSLELYMSDPLSYFIEKGLKIKKPQVLAMDPLHLGTLNHALVEHDATSHDALWEQLLENFPKHSKRLAMIKDRNDVMMHLNQEYLKTVDANSHFDTIKREANFDVTGLVHPQIRLRGRIDRIDATDSYLRVIDYKSSANSLSVPKVLAGTQLQLLTYALVGETLYQKPVMGVFYFSFKLPNLNHTTLSFSKSKGLVVNDPDFLEMWEKEKRLNGWFFITPTDEFEDASRFKGLRETKSGLSVGQPYDFEITRQNLNTIYKDIFNNLMNGVLDVKDMIMTLPKDTKFKTEKETLDDDNL